jgi:uncharacterized membrane protein HdeD (DUF308 family)
MGQEKNYLSQKKETNIMKLNAPKVITWWIAVIVGVLGIVASFVTIPVLSVYAFWLVVVGFVLLVLGTFVKGL